MKRGIIFFLTVLILCVSCQKNGHTDKDAASKHKSKITVSNMSDEGSIEKVRAVLKKSVAGKDADDFIKAVKDYNNTIEKTGLTGAFEERVPVYDSDTIHELWSAKKGDFLGTNCRITAFTLLKDTLKIKQGPVDDALLFLDKDAIDTERIFNEGDKRRFMQLFSRVQTENTKDIHIHAEKMKEHFSNIGFSQKAKMLSVVLHDNFDGDYLFIGHTGVLLEDAEGFLFLEKLSFAEPFQAVRFRTKQDCYEYLFLTYKHYRDETTAYPFIMENGELIELELYNTELD